MKPGHSQHLYVDGSLHQLDLEVISRDCNVGGGDGGYGGDQGGGREEVQQDDAALH